MKFLRYIPLLLLSGMAVPVSAQEAATPPSPPSAADNRLYAAVTIADMRRIVETRGDTVIEQEADDRPRMTARTADGLRYNLTGNACDAQQSCNGLVVQIFYEEEPGLTLEGVNNANNESGAVAIFWERAAHLFGFTRYIILDGGVTMANIEANLDVLIFNHRNRLRALFPDSAETSPQG